MDIRKGAAIAAAVGALLVGCGDGEDVGGTVEGLKCVGGNECKGMSECAGMGKNDCQGMNECAGMGWISVDTEAECEEHGGEIEGA